MVTQNPDSVTVAPTDCPDCCGCGVQYFRGGFSLPCPTCRGTGNADPATTDRLMWSWLVTPASVTTTGGTR
jgi:hypothetical protein